MSTTILRVEKVKSMANIRQAGAHQHRHHLDTPNADPKLAKLNHIFKGTSNLAADVKARLDTLSKPPRSNAVLAMDGVLSLSPDMFADKATEWENTKAFANNSARFLREKFGDNIVSIVLHRDESTPHIHFTVVPIDEKEGGRRVLNARDMFNKIELSKLQKEYFEHMALSLPRLSAPNYGSKAKHTTIKQFYSQIEKIGESVKLDVTSVFDEFKNGHMERLNELVMQRVDKHLENLLESLEGRLSEKVRAELRREAYRSGSELKNSVASMITNNATLRISEGQLHKKIDETIKLSSAPRPRL
jgi:hypothetical protein